MFADNAQISHRQLFRQTVTGLLGIYFLLVPVFPELSGRQGIFSLLAGMLVYMFLGIYFIRIKTVFQNVEKYMGKAGGRIFTLLFVSWLRLMGVYLLLVTARITEHFLIEGSRSWLVIALAGMVTYLGSRQGMEQRARMAEVCFPLLLLILAGMLCMGIMRVNPVYLAEMGELSFRGWLKGTYEVLCVFLPFAFWPVILGNVRKAAETEKVMCKAIALLTGLLIFSLLLLQGSFGLGGYEHKAYPMIDFMAGIKIAGDFVERVDVFWVALALFSILFGIGSVFFYNYELLKRVKLEKTSVVSAVGIIAAAELCQKLEISERFFLALTEKFYAPLFAVLLLWAGFSGKRKHNIKTALLLLGAFSLCLFSLSGCGVSLEDRVFPLSMGADYAQGEYQLIYGIPELTQITGQNKEDTEETQAQAVVYGGKRPQDAEENFNKNQEKYLDMGHIKVLILGKELLENRGAMEEFLAYMEGKPAVAGNLYVFSCKDVGEVMSLDGQGRESVGDYLSGILENNLDKKEKQAVTLQDLYNAWHRKEKMPKLPSVTVVNKRPRLRQYS